MMTRTDLKSSFDSMAIALGGIWTSVLAISLLSPDMVSGSEQQHMPMAALTTWIWGSIATFAVLSFWAGARSEPGRLELLRPVSIGVAMVWCAAAAVAIFGPEMVTGSDPTRIPMAAFLAPVAATIVTAVIRAGADLVAQAIDEDY
jgi:hypothetical protein